MVQSFCLGFANDIALFETFAKLWSTHGCNRHCYRRLDGDGSAAEQADDRQRGP